MTINRLAALICAMLIVFTLAAPARAGDHSDGRGVALVLGVIMTMAVLQQAQRAQAAPVYPQTSYVSPYTATQQNVAVPTQPPVYAQPTYQAPMYQAPAYQAPVYQAPAYQATAVSRQQHCRQVGVARNGSTLYACR